MKRDQGVAIVMLFFAAVLAGCWKQRDVISIAADGGTTFHTDVTITEKEFSVGDIDELSSGFMDELTKAGWQVEKHWVSKSRPYMLSFVGQGNIRRVTSAADFYSIRKVSDNTYAIRFFPAEAKGGKSSRSIKFEHGFFSRGPHILDAAGKDVKEIANVADDQTYKIVF